ncbi:MAG: Holliday junction resolvase RuvX [Baekduia sp.]
MTSSARGARRVLALDYGAARCGCAVSDPTGTIATPIEQIERPGTRRGLARVAELVRDVEAELVLVGLPLTLRGEDSDQTRESREWAERLADRIRPVPVELYDERFTTQIAARGSADARTGEDSRAAAVLLEEWLSVHGGER